jgi:DNA-binding transcriptional MerR regulator
MSNTKKPIVHLRVYKGLQLFYDANGKVMNPNQLVKLTHDTIEWKNFLKNVQSLGFNSIKVEKMLNGTTLEEIEIQKEIEVEVADVFKKKEVELTADQKRIADLEARIEALSKKEKPEGINLLGELKEEYEKLSGKKAHHLWKEDKLVELIEELKSQQ